MAKRPQPPAALGAAGKALWRRVLALGEPEPGELELLRIACRAEDRVVELRRLIDEDGLMVAGSRGQRVLHPAMSELRQAEALSLSALRNFNWPDDEDRPDGRTRRGTFRSGSAQAAAQARWRRGA